MWTYDFWYYSIPANGSEHNRNYEQTQNYPCISLLPREPYCSESLHFSPSCTRLPLPPSTVRNMVWNNCVGRKIFNEFLCTWYVTIPYFRVPVKMVQWYFKVWSDKNDKNMSEKSMEDLPSVFLYTNILFKVPVLILVFGKQTSFI